MAPSDRLGREDRGREKIFQGESLTVNVPNGFLIIGGKPRE